MSEQHPTPEHAESAQPGLLKLIGDDAGYCADGVCQIPSPEAQGQQTPSERGQ